MVRSMAQYLVSQHKTTWIAHCWWYLDILELRCMWYQLLQNLLLAPDVNPNLADGGDMKVGESTKGGNRRSSAQEVAEKINRFLLMLAFPANGMVADSNKIPIIYCVLC